MMLVWTLASALGATPHSTTASEGLDVAPRLEPGSPIVYGEPESGYPAAVGLGTFNFSACTGSVITPRLILTAAHCGADVPLDLVVDFGHAFFGADALEPDQTVGFTEVFLHPDYVPLGPPALPGQTQQLPEFDVALLVLAEDAPVEPVWFRTEPLDDAQVVGEEIVSVGWGQTEANELIAGVKYSAVLTVDRLDPFFVISDSDTNEQGANICSGDSGGPQYHVEDDGSLVQWAVHSWGDTGCLYTSGSTRTDIIADWVLEHVEQVHGTTDLCEINGLYEDGACDSSCDTPDPDCSAADAVADPSADEASGGCSTVPQGATGALALLGLLMVRRR